MKKNLLRLVSLLFIALLLTPHVGAGHPEPEDWEIRANYYNYYENKGKDPAPKPGYLADRIVLKLTEEFAGENETFDPSVLGEAAAKVVSFEYYRGIKKCVLNYNPGTPLVSENGVDYYSVDDVEGVIEDVRAMRALEFVESALPDTYCEQTVLYGDDWRIYDNYFYYNDPEHKKTSGFAINSVMLRIRESFLEEVGEFDASYFPGIADKIVGVSTLTPYKTVIISLEDKANPDTEYTEAEIDDYIACVDYLLSLSFVESAQPNGITKVVVGPPIPSEPDPGTGDQQNPGAQNETGDNEERNSLQTGDALFFLIASASFAACLGLAAAVKKKHSS